MKKKIHLTGLGLEDRPDEVSYTHWQQQQQQQQQQKQKQQQQQQQPPTTNNNLKRTDARCTNGRASCSRR
jgi:hypothetical protein